MNTIWNGQGNAQYQALAASAGSGKTYALTHRIIGLLAHQVPPERIVGLTFSRKSAGEILDDTLKYLCEGASDPAAASRHAEQAFCEASCGDFRRLLRTVVDALPRLRLQTLDSFSVGMLRAFALELGLSGELQIIDGNDVVVKTIQDRLLRQMVLAEERDASLASGFLHDFKEATAGRPSKGVRQAIGDFIRSYHGLLARFPKSEAWGRRERIWPTGFPFAPVADPQALAGEWRAALAGNDSLPASLSGFVDKALAARPGSSTEYGVLGDRLFPQVAALRAGEPVEFKAGSKMVVIDGRCGQLLGELLGHVVAADVEVALRRTAGIHKLMLAYERAYDGEVRRRGRMSFADLQTVLDPDYGDGERALRFQDICFRLDGRFDHWLLDEFQDTSDAQWRILAGLIEEVVSDPSGTRSLFYVGDVKQAIYQWREGNPRLFGQVAARYRERLEVGGLHVCYRQSQSVIAAVNTVFGTLAASGFSGLPADATERWRQIWETHQARPAAPPGYCALQEVGKAVDDEAKPELVEVARLVNAIQPTQRGLSTAVLVRGNAFGKQVADYLRSQCPGVEVALEGRSTLCDSVAVTVVLSLLRVAAHPGDGLAWRHVELSPLGLVLRQRRIERWRLPQLLAGQVHEEGFRGAVRHWGELLLGQLPAAAAFDRQRLAGLAETAAAYDALGDPDLSRFVAYVEAYSGRENSRQSAVRVMTCHQAKGLGFDLVILPDLIGHGSIQKAATGGLFALTHSRPDWVLKRPARETRLALPEIDQAWSQADADACFEELCVLYVAMTRAKLAMYMIVPPAPKTSTAIYCSTLLRDMLTGEPGPPGGDLLWQTGEPDWFAGAVGTSEAPPPALRDLPVDFAEQAASGRLRRITPSAETEAQVPAAWFFTPGRNDALVVGNAVHEIMEQVGWLDDSDPAAALAAWLAAHPRLPSQARAEIERHLGTAFAAPPVRAVFTRPREGAVELWRERPFEAMLDGGWVSGVFDRVVVVRNAPGAVERATIVDFKTDSVADPEAVGERCLHHRPQLELYRRVLARILGVQPARIDLQLIFTAVGQVRQV